MAHTTTRDRLNNRRPSRNGYVPTGHVFGSVFVLIAFVVVFVGSVWHQTGTDRVTPETCAVIAQAGASDHPFAVACAERYGR